MINVLNTFFRRLVRIQNTQTSKVLWLTLAVTCFACSGFLFFEQPKRPDLTWSDSLWWAVVTMTTVGYGDFFPETFGGRYLVGFPTMLIGISILGYVLSVFAQSLLEAYGQELKGMANLEIKNHVIVVHYPSTTRIETILNELRLDPKTQDSQIVLVDEELEELPEALKKREIRFVKGDPALAETMERANVTRASIAIILARDPLDTRSDNHSLAAVLTLEQMNPSLHSVVECVSPARVELMKRAGADSTVCVADFASTLLVQEAIDPGSLQALEQMATNKVGEQIYMVRINASGPRPFSEASAKLAEEKLLAIGYQEEGETHLNPGPDHILQPGGHLVCLGRNRVSTIEL